MNSTVKTHGCADYASPILCEPLSAEFASAGNGCRDAVQDEGEAPVELVGVEVGGVIEGLWSGGGEERESLWVDELGELTAVARLRARGIRTPIMPVWRLHRW